MIKDKKAGLGLSGGGYRAAAFHLGTLRKLHQLGLLGKIDGLSTISGGSIAGAFYLLNYKGDWPAFEKLMTEKLKTSTIKAIALHPLLIATVLALMAIPVLTFLVSCNGWLACLSFLVALALLVVFQFKIMPLTFYKIQAYRKIFFGGALIKNLPEYPRAAINASNLQTGTFFTFSGDKMGDSSYTHPANGEKPVLFKQENFPVATAVAASTSVPFIFSPVTIGAQFYESSSHYNGWAQPALVDGGVYDNQGIHKLTQANSSYSCDIVVCSDGSMPFVPKFSGLNSIMVLYRSTDIMMRKIKNMQFLRDVYGGKHEIAYFSMNWEYERVFDELVNYMKKNKLQTNLQQYYKLDANWTTGANTIEANRNNIKNRLKELIKYNEIVKEPITTDQIKEISKIGTNLTALSDEQIKLLSGHAAILTEIHVKLYCPSAV